MVSGVHSRLRLLEEANSIQKYERSLPLKPIAPLLWLSLHTSTLATSRRTSGSRSNWLYFIRFKPDRFLNVRSFESDLVETKRLIKINSNGIDSLDRSPEASERTITGHPYPTAYLKYAVSDSTLNSFLAHRVFRVLHLAFSSFISLLLSIVQHCDF
jgi:hypothetical protein